MKYSISRDKLFSFFRQRKFDIGILCVGVLLGVAFDFGLAETLFFLVFIWSIVGPIQSRWLLFFSACFFFVIPILLLFDFKDYAEKTSIYAYYLLVILIIRVIMEMKDVSKSQ